MARMSVEIEGSADEVVLVMRQLGGAGRQGTADDAGRSIGKPAEGVREITPADGTEGAATAQEAAPAEWTESLARDFLDGLEPAARRVAEQVWQAGDAAIHRSVLCQRAELAPAELRCAC